MPNFHSTLLARPASTKSPTGMEIDKQISPISAFSPMSQLNMLNVSSFDETVIPNSGTGLYDQTTIKDVENQATVIGGDQSSFHEEC